MKKLFYTLAFMLYATSTMAETIVVIDDNGYVTRQMTTNTVTSVSQPAVLSHTVTTTTSPALTVVRQYPTQTNNYYYDDYSTGSAILAGITTAVVGAILYDGYKSHHHHHKIKAPVQIKHHGGHKHRR